MQLVSSKHWDALLSALFPWGHHLEVLPVCAAWRCGIRIATGTGGVLGNQSIISWAGIWTLQRFPWQEPCHAAFLDTDQEKLQRCPVFCLLCPVIQSKRKKMKFQQFGTILVSYGSALSFQDFLQAWVILYLLPLPGNTSRTCRARLNQQGKYRTFSRLCNQIFWARKKETKPKPYVMTVVGYSCVFSTTELYQIIRSPLQTHFV